MRSLKILTIINVAFGVLLFLFIYTMLPFAIGVISDTAARGGNEYPELETWVLILSSISPGLIIGLATFIAHRVKENLPKLSLILLLLFPTIITLYVGIQFVLSVFT
ncbi:MAG: hypothetical protein ROO71_00355 [Balneola sp.]